MSETTMGTKEAERKPSKSWVEKAANKIFNTTAGRWTIGAIVAATGVAGIGKAYDHYVLEPARPIYQDLESPTFDPSALDTHINANNSVQMTLKESEESAPPILQEENRIMTFILPIKFKDDRIPTLHIQKMNDGMGDLQGNNLIQIDDGLQEGDIIFSPYDGLLTVPQITAQTGDLETFYLHPDASSPDEVFQKYTNMYFDMTSLKPLVNLDQAVKDNWNNLNIPIKKDQPIGTILTSYEGKSFKPNIKISWMTSGTEKSFNLATSEGKVIIIK